MTKPGLVLLGLGLLAFGFADLELSNSDPLQEILALLQGAVQPSPDFSLSLWQAVLNTLTFAIIGTTLGALVGGFLSWGYRWWPVKVITAFLRSIHELFWAFLLLPLLGLTPLCGVLAIAIPFSGIFAKVYAELFEEARQARSVELPLHTRHLDRFFYVWLPELWGELKHYTSYRFECALRSSAVLGFIGLPTLGYHLETWFREGDYGQAFFLLYLFYLIIASLRLWAKPSVMPWAVMLAVLLFPSGNSFSMGRLHQYLTVDLWPWPLRQGEGWVGLWAWVARLWSEQAVEGIVQSLIVAQLAVLLSGLLALVWFPFVSRRFVGSWSGRFSFFVLVVLRSTPEYLLAYVLLVIFGPSLLPAVIALSLHNGSILAHLTGKRADQGPGYWSTKPVNQYLFETLPRVWSQFFAYLAYRWEVIIRESAIMGFLGIYTLGFYIDSAFSFNRYDEALFLILIAAMLNLSVDRFGRFLRKQIPQ